ncbi:MAG TPA: glycosyltransferase family 2 protein [Solimonas sp.]|nr:glycosyltransferase family 2 protein [Solimonas sp.]
MHAATPWVSVILPTFNRAGTLPRALASVLAQSVGELELIVVDDGSTDGTAQLMAGIRDPRVRYVPRERNGGPAATRNSGIELARGEFVAFQDSDDEWLPLKLEKQLAALEAAGPQVGLALCGQLRWDTRELVYLPGHARRGARSGRLRQEILRNNFALTPSWLVRRAVFGQIGAFDETLPMLEDWEWLIRYTERGAAVLVDEPLMMVWESPDSISHNHAKYIPALEAIIARHRAALAGDPRSLAGLHYVLGKKLALHGSPAQAREEFRAALRLWPRDWRHWAVMALTLAGSQRLFQKVWRHVRRLKGFEVPHTDRP